MIGEHTHSTPLAHTQHYSTWFAHIHNTYMYTHTHTHAHTHITYTHTHTQTHSHARTHTHHIHTHHIHVHTHTPIYTCTCKVIITTHTHTHTHTWNSCACTQKNVDSWFSTLWVEWYPLTNNGWGSKVHCIVSLSLLLFTSVQVHDRSNLPGVSQVVSWSFNCQETWAALMLVRKQVYYTVCV